MSRSRGRMLVIRGGAIGDFILTLPAIAALRSTFPETHVELLGYPALAELAKAGGVIDGSRSIEARPLARFFARNAALDPEWSAYFESFDLILSYLFDPDELFKTNIGRASKAQFLQARHRPDEREDDHATRVFLKPLEQLAIFGADPLPRIQVGGFERNGLIAVHPGSGSEKKNWPEEKWAELLPRLGGEVLLVGGEAEGGRLDRLARQAGPGKARVAQNRPLAELAGLLAGCRALIGHDSGIAHLAAALGLPTIVLWGPSNERIWRPPHENCRIVRAASLRELAVGEVLQAVEGLGQEKSATP